MQVGFNLVPTVLVTEENRRDTWKCVPRDWYKKYWNDKELCWRVQTMASIRMMITKRYVGIRIFQVKHCIIE